MSYKYFSDEELTGLTPDTCAMLDDARGRAGIPFRLTATTGGVHAQNSAHYKGLAADIGLGHLSAGFVRDRGRFLIVKGLLDAGCQRIEACEAHVHADSGKLPDYNYPVLILGKDN